MKSVLIRLGMAALIAVAATPASAQFQSDSYKFLKAVRDQDVLKAKEMTDKPGSTVVNSKDYSTGETAMHIVVKRRDAGWINFLAQAGAKMDVRDAQGRTPLILAAQLGFVDGIKLLIYRGADVNGSDEKGQTALIYAVQARDAASVRALIENGADPDQKDHFTGRSARDYAAADSRGAAFLKIMESATPAKKKAAAGMMGPR